MKLKPRDDDEEVFLAILREDLGAFVEWAYYEQKGEDALYLPNYHVDAIVHRLTQCATGTVKRLLITVPPRYLKSHCVSVCFPAWILSRNPAAKFMCVSYGDKASSEFAVGTKTLMQSPTYQKANPGTVLADNSPIDMLRTTAGGTRMATSVQGSATSFGCDFLLIDDMTKASSTSNERLAAIDKFQSTFMSRLDAKRDGVVIVVAQRTHTDDLPGYLLAQGDWVHLDLPAIAPENALIDTGAPTPYARKKGKVLHEAREDRDTLEQIRKEIGDAAFAAQYLQRPGAPQGAMFPPRWFPRYAEPFALHPADVAARISGARHHYRDPGKHHSG